MDWMLIHNVIGDYQWLVLRRLPDDHNFDTTGDFYVYDLWETEQEAREQLAELAG